MNLTDNEIIKALECCSGENLCSECPMYKRGSFCMGKLFRNSLDLINRQKAEIEKLTVVKNAFGLSLIRIRESLDKNGIGKYDPYTDTFERNGG